MNPFKTGRIISSVSGLTITFLLLIWGSYIRQQAYDRQETINVAVKQNSNLAVTLEQYAIHTIRYADAVLQLVKMQYDSKGKINFENVLSVIEINKDIIKDIAVIDSNGRMIEYMNHKADPSRNYSKLNYFTFHSKSTKDSLFISAPVLSETIGKAVIIISRRLNNVRGRFSGIVALQIEPNTFTSFYAQANLTKNEIISLISPEGITYARRTGPVESYGENIIKSPLFIHIKHHPDSFYFAKDAIRGIPTWFSYRKLKNYPIIATVGTSEADMLERYYSNRERYLVPRIIASVLGVLFSISISVVLIHRKKMQERIIEEEKRYQRLLTQQVIAAQEKERAYIGRELHDNVNQVLTTVKLYLETALNKEDLKDHFISRSMQLVNGSINEIRNLSHQLSSPTLGTGSLIDTINALIEMVVTSGNLVIEFDHRKYCRSIDMSQKLALYRIVQEQLNNILKHAAATKVWISLKQTDTSTILIIKDNGIGFNHAEKQNGIGLNNIITRVKALDGNVLIKSAVQKGCMLRVFIPIGFNEL